MADPTFISWDWKSGPSHDELKRALGPLGVRVYKNPSCEGSDGFGYIFADRDLTRQEVRALADEHAEG